MNTVDTILDTLPANNLELYKELGHEAGKKGKLEECINWYKKGLDKARSLENKEAVKEFTNLIFTLL